MTRVLVIDNYDSFVYNIVQYLGQLGVTVEVKRNDEITVAEAKQYEGILISPGPGTPADAGICIEVIKQLGGVVPIFGVCLGHQAIAEAFGATVSRAPELLHGKTSEIYHQGKSVMTPLPNPFTATRYHSLAVESATVPAELEVTGQTETGIVMGLKHKTLDIEGVQFHPESVLTEGGHIMLAEWLVRCGAEDAPSKAIGLTPLITKSVD